MRPERRSRILLSATRSKAKMIEYGVPEDDHIALTQDPARLFTLAIAILGDLAAETNRGTISPEELREIQGSLLFSAHFLDSYAQTGLNSSIDQYVVLLASASYYLASLPGSSRVLARQLGNEYHDLGGGGLEHLLRWTLNGSLASSLDTFETEYGELITSISQSHVKYFSDGTGDQFLQVFANQLRTLAYETGTPRQLLLADVVGAVLKKKIENSCWKVVPQYSELGTELWDAAMRKDTFPREFWPAQHLLGQHGVLRGVSAVVQMPTSAGKTKAMELVIRSSFLSGRASLALVVAPFRALCSEIKNSLVSAFCGEDVEVDELSDVLQMDVNLEELTISKHVLTVTPEKLVYVLRHSPVLASNVGLVIFDEGHQFDSGERGVTYELLLTTLRSMLLQTTQKVLVSAVIANARSIADWLNGLNSVVVAGSNLLPMFRSTGFVSWLDARGRIEYVSDNNPDSMEYFVPRVIETVTLKKRPRERKPRIFPDKSDPKAIALHLGLKLAPRGGIAIFCGQKATVEKLCKIAVDAVERGLSMPLPNEVSDPLELQRLEYLLIENLGPEATATKCSSYGIFAHHGNTPRGIRLALEHAMREGLVRFVVCTSTLAQGVNLPIRYLIVTGVQQGQNSIKVRDFHNLIGRAGRAGMHTEGSIIFSDPRMYDGRLSADDRWRWDRLKQLLDPNNSEISVSSLIAAVEPISSNFNGKTVTYDAIDFADAYVNSPDRIAGIPGYFTQRHGEEKFTENAVRREIAWRIKLFSAIESFLLSQFDTEGSTLSEQDVTDIAEDTLAYFLSDEKARERIRQVFKLLSENISQNIADPARRISYGKTLFGVRDAISIESWLRSNVPSLGLAQTDDELLEIIWEIMVLHISDKKFIHLNASNIAREVAQAWIRGESYCKILVGQETTSLSSVEDIVEVCEGALAYEGTLVVSALCDLIGLQEDARNESIFNRLQLFQKKLKYGLPTEGSICLYELGFADRVIAQDLELNIGVSGQSKRDIVRFLKTRTTRARSVIEKYPNYFHQRMQDILL